MIGVTSIDIRRDGRQHNATKLSLEVLIPDNAQPRKRHELMAIGLIMLLQSNDADLALYVTQKIKIDPEKYQAILALIGCTQAEVEADDPIEPARYRTVLKEGVAK